MVVYKNSTRKVPGGKIVTSTNAAGVTTTTRTPNSPNSQKTKPKTKEATRRQAMLNTHRLSPFKYDMSEILANSQMDEAKASAFLASVTAKASRQSTRDGKDFIKTFLEEGDISKEEFDKMCRLLDKYSKYR